MPVRGAAHVPGALAGELVGAVEDQPADVVAVTERVGLREEAAVGVPVEEDVTEAERLADRLDVLGGGLGAVGEEPGAELCGAAADDRPLGDLPLL